MNSVIKNVISMKLDKEKKKGDTARYHIPTTGKDQVPGFILQ